MRTGRQRAPRRRAVRRLPLIPGPLEIIKGREVLLAGLFSAQQKDHLACMGVLAAEAAALGGLVAGCFVQRRGISGGKKGSAPGGKDNMSKPYSSRTLMSTGKIHEIARERASADAAAVVFFNPLTDRQRMVLSELIGCPVFSRTDLQPAEAAASAPAEMQSRLLEPLQPRRAATRTAAASNGNGGNSGDRMS